LSVAKLNIFCREDGMNRHSGESQNPVFSARESGLQRNEDKGGMACSGGLAAMGAMTPGFWLAPE
jgi:hypothetical protein